MNKKIKSLVDGILMVAAAVAMMTVAIGVIILITKIFHTNVK